MVSNGMRQAEHRQLCSRKEQRNAPDGCSLGFDCAKYLLDSLLLCPRLSQRSPADSNW